MRNYRFIFVLIAFVSIICVEYIYLYGTDRFNITAYFNYSATNTQIIDEIMIKERPQFLLLQCYGQENVNQIQEALDFYSLYIQTIRYYAWYHGYKYHLELTNMNDMSGYLTLYHNLECGPRNFQCRRMWKIWCIEKVLAKYNPEWLIFIDLDMAISPYKMFIPLPILLENIAIHYNRSRDLNDISFICCDELYSMNTGLMIFHNQNYSQLVHNQYFRLLNSKNQIFNNNGKDISIVLDLYTNYTINATIQTGTVFESPFIQSFFDINKYIWYRDGNNNWISDQLAVMESMLFVADWWYNNIEHKNRIKKTYNGECMKNATSGNTLNTCWWKTLDEKYNYTFNKRVWGPFILSDDNSNLQFRNKYRENHWIWHNHCVACLPKVWLAYYKLMFDHPVLMNVSIIVTNETKQDFTNWNGTKWNGDYSYMI